MKAVVKPQSGAGLALTEVPMPVVGPRDVLIQVKAVAICGSDLPIYTWDDPWVRTTVSPGQIVGHEFCGIVADIGGQVERFSRGQLVTAEGHLNCGICTICLNNDGHICPQTRLLGFDYPGAFAEYIVVPASHVILLPGLPLEIAAIQDPFGNAVHAVSVVPPTNCAILVTGCGPLGLMAITLAKHAGARQIFATDISDYRLSLALTMGASAALRATDPDSSEFIRRATEMNFGVDILMEMSGSASAINEGFSLLRPGGSAVLMGLPKVPLPFDFSNELITKGITAYGLTGRRMFSTWYEATKYLSPSHGFRNIDLLPIVTHRFLLEDFEQAFELVEKRQCGKVVMFLDKTDLAHSNRNARSLGGPDGKASSS